MSQKTQGDTNGFSEPGLKFLITGGTGTLGEALTRRLMKTAKEVRVYSRDEYKQSEMARKIPSKNVSYWLGDVCDLERLSDACKGVDIIIHTAAFKRMDQTSRNTFVVADVNIRGTSNVMLAGKHCKKIIFISTDKAYSPANVYGASKMIAEKIVLAYPNGIVWRFGNFIGSRGSVWEIFKDQYKNGLPLTITDPEATRFVIPLEEVCDYVLSDVKSGLHYPKDLKSMTVLEIAESIAPGAKHRIVGLREDEKLHEAFEDNYTSKK